MRNIKLEPILTETFDMSESFVPEEGSLYVYGNNSEERSRHIENWLDTVDSIKFRHICDEKPLVFFLDDGKEYFLRSGNSLEGLWDDLAEGSKIYIDITGLTHSVWAAVLKSALNSKYEVLVVYVEPESYVRSGEPVEGQVYDLSERISGIAPLPGFAVLSRSLSAEFLFVPLLGFEGTRLKFLIEEIQPGHDQILPVVGLPGFEAWYVFETYKGNKSALLETDCWQTIRHAQGNCPFSCFYLLEDIIKDENLSIKVAPIGTKPHALGAVLFAIKNPHLVEIIYDHPVRKTGRTDGASKLHVYHVSALVNSGS